MLIFSRKPNEGIIVELPNGQQIYIAVTEVNGNQVRRCGWPKGHCLSCIINLGKFEPHKRPTPSRGESLNQSIA